MVHLAVEMGERFAFLCGARGGRRFNLSTTDAEVTCSRCKKKASA